MSNPIVDDPETLAGVVRQLGGTMVEGRTFRFDLPRANVKEVVEKINKLGIGVRRISERTEQGPKVFTVTRLECFKRPAQKLDRLPEW
jgi:hypothetical protein